MTFFFVFICNCRFIHGNYFDKKRIKVEKAPGPTEVEWNNLRYNEFHRIMRIFVSYLITILCLGGALTINILVDNMKRSEKYAQNFLIDILATIITMVINYLLKPISGCLTRFEMHETYSKDRVSYSFKLVVSWYINICLIPFITFLVNHFQKDWL